MSVTIEKDSKGRDEIVTLKTTDDSTSAQIRCFGATLVSWRVNETELIFVSPKATLHNEEQGKPVRGGIPIVFPQFGPGKMQQHGFARNLRWSLSKHGLDPIHGQPFVVFELEPTPYSQAMWPFSFRLLLHIAIRPATLITKLEVFNMEASSPFQFQSLFHTYLEVGDVRKTLVRGLQGLHYTDNDGSLNGKKQQLEEELCFEAEVDRAYALDSKCEKVTVADVKRGLKIQVDFVNGFNRVVVWNPWTAKAEAMADLGAENHHRFVCIEPGFTDDYISLSPDQHWSCEQRLSVSRL